MKLLDYIAKAMPMRIDTAKEVTPAYLKHTPYHYLLYDAPPKMCYVNIYNALNNSLDTITSTNSFYVLGVATINDVAIEHAFIKLNGIYFDPTWENLGSLGDEYISLVELTLNDVITIMDRSSGRCGSTSVPPDLYTVSKYGL